MAAAEVEPDAVGRELMIGQRANGQSCCPIQLCHRCALLIAVTVVRGFCVGASRAMRELLAVISL